MAKTEERRVVKKYHKALEVYVSLLLPVAAGISDGISLPHALSDLFPSWSISSHATKYCGDFSMLDRRLQVLGWWRKTCK